MHTLGMAQKAFLLFPSSVLTVSGSTGIISVLSSDTPKVVSNVSKKHIPACFISGNFGDACLAGGVEDV
jgi:hypothetical protein